VTCTETFRKNMTFTSNGDCKNTLISICTASYTARLENLGNRRVALIYSYELYAVLSKQKMSSVISGSLNIR
jgi:hypothetical protein